MNYKEVTKDEFYKTIGPLDVVISLLGDYPYTSIFKLRNGTEKGKIVENYPEGGRWPIETKYLIVN